MKSQDGNYIQTCPFIGPHISGIHFDVHSGLSTLAFKNGEQLEFFGNIILRLQQEIILSGETIYPTKDNGCSQLSTFYICNTTIRKNISRLLKN